MTWVTPPQSLEPRRIEEIEVEAEAVYAGICEAEEAADRRHDFSDHLDQWADIAWMERER